MSTTVAGEVVKEHLLKFPTVGSLTLAKKLYKEYGELFLSVDDARGIIRYYRRAHGSASRKKVKTDKYEHRLPKPEVEKYTPYKCTGKNIGIISDTQLPFFDKKALNEAERRLRDCDTIIMNGDIFDFYGISRFEKDPRIRKLKEEIEDGRKFFTWLRERFAKARLIFKEGNHCERWEKYLKIKAPELFDIPEFRLDVLMQAGSFGIEWVRDRSPILAGKLTILHGHEIPSVGTINPARNLFIKTGGNTLIGHIHKTDNYHGNTPNEVGVSAFTTGCLCGLRPKWLRNNQWNHGAARVEVDKDGNYLIDNFRIK